jgi:hypothetical protein
MLKVLNLYIIDQIFSEAVGVSAMSKMIYINCLMHHFRNKPPTASSVMAFDLFKDDFGNFEKYKRNFQELHKAGLVELGFDKISFNNTWGKHIDWSQLEKVSANVYVGGLQFKTIKDFEKDLRGNYKMSELAQMKFHISAQQVEKLVELFIKEQETYEKTYMNLSDAMRHCTSWIGVNSAKVPSETIKSKGKILGR